MTSPQSVSQVLIDCPSLSYHLLSLHRVDTPLSDHQSSRPISRDPPGRGACYDVRYCFALFSLLHFTSSISCIKSSAAWELQGGPDSEFMFEQFRNFWNCFIRKIAHFFLSNLQTNTVQLLDVMSIFRNNELVTQS